MIWRVRTNVADTVLSLYAWKNPTVGCSGCAANDWRAPHQYSGPVIGQTELSIKKFCTRRLPFYIFRIQGIHALMRRAPPTPSEPQLNSTQFNSAEPNWWSPRAREAGVLEYFTVLMQGIKIKWKCLFWPAVLCSAAGQGMCGVPAIAGLSFKRFLKTRCFLWRDRKRRSRETRQGPTGCDVIGLTLRNCISIWWKILNRNNSVMIFH